MKKYIYSISLLLIVIIAVFFRFYHLSTVPPSPSLDEVTIGYNAYSILHTGKDEYGNFFPLLLRAYDDWRPALYVYLVVPFVKLLGLTIFAIRLPSVILSVVTVFVSFFLVIEMLHDWPHKKIIAIMVSFFLSISPWHIYISRLGHEVNLGLTCAIVALYTFLFSINHPKRRWFLVVSAFLFAVSLDTYQSEKVFMPIMVVILSLLFWKQAISNKKIFIIALIVGSIVAIPFIDVSLSSQGLFRLQGTSAFSGLDSIYQQTSRELLVDKQKKDVIGEILHNRRMVIPTIFINNYASHFNLKWLFTNGGLESFKAPGFGLFYPWELLFMIAGILFSFALSMKVRIFLLGWVLAALVAPAITTQSPHAMRAINVLPIPQVLIALGLFGISQVFIYRKWRVFFTTVYLFIICIFIIGGAYKFYQQYFYAFPKQESSSFQYPLSESIKYAIANQNKYKYIIISNNDALMQSYMFYLYYSKYDPQKYLAMGGTKSGGFAQWHKIGKFEFRTINWSKDSMFHNVLVIGNVSDFPNRTGYDKTFNTLDNVRVVLASSK